MISRTQFAAGAILFLQSIALGSNIVGAEIDDARKLRGATSDEQGDRDLAPFGFGQGYGYTTNSNRQSYARTRDGSLGSQVLRPYSPPRTQAYQRPGRDVPPPPPVERPPPMGGGGGKSKAGKATKGFQPARPRPTNPGGIGNMSPGVGMGGVMGGGMSGGMSGGSNGGGRGFASSMNWQRIPNQPLFVSNRDIPVIVLTEPYETATDRDGNTVLVDPNGNVLVIKFDPSTGDWIVQTGDNQNILSFDEQGNVLVDPAGNREEPTVSPAPTDSPAPSEEPTTSFAPQDFSLNPTLEQGTGDPTPSPTKEPTRTPTKNPTGIPSKPPTKAPTKNPTKNPTGNPTKSPTKNPTKEPTKNPTKEPTKNPTANPTKDPTPQPTASRRLLEE